MNLLIRSIICFILFLAITVILFFFIRIIICSYIIIMTQQKLSQNKEFGNEFL